VLEWYPWQVSLLKAALGFAASAYANDVVLRPRQMGKVARGYCDRVGKPLLFMRCAGLTDRLVGPPVRAEAEADRAYPVRVPDKTFGAVFAVGVLERQSRPWVALAEWRRVADRVFVVVPSWFSPHAWLDPTHQWVIDPRLKMAAPLWNGQRHVRLLEMSDSGYGKRPWTPTTNNSRSSGHRPSAPRPPFSRSPSPSGPSPYGAPLPRLLSSHLDPSSASSSESYPSSELHPSSPGGSCSEGIPVPDLRTPRSGLSNSGLHLTVVSPPDFDESW